MASTTPRLPPSSLPRPGTSDRINPSSETHHVARMTSPSHQHRRLSPTRSPRQLTQSGLSAYPDLNRPFAVPSPPKLGTTSPILPPAQSPSAAAPGFNRTSPSLSDTQRAGKSSAPLPTGSSAGSSSSSSSLFNLLWVPPSPNDAQNATAKFPSPGPSSSTTAANFNGGSQTQGASMRTSGTSPLSATYPASMIAPALPNSPPTVGGPAGMGTDDLQWGLPPPVPGAVTAFGVWNNGAADASGGYGSAGATSAYRDDAGRSGSQTSQAPLSLPSLSYLSAPSAIPPSSTYATSQAGQAYGGYDAQSANRQYYLPRPSMAAYRYSSSGSSSALEDPMHRSSSTYSSASSLSTFNNQRTPSYYAGNEVYGARPGPTPSMSGDGSVADSSDESRFSGLSLRSGLSRTNTGFTSMSEGGSDKGSRMGSSNHLNVSSHDKRAQVDGGYDRADGTYPPLMRAAVPVSGSSSGSSATIHASAHHDGKQKPPRRAPTQLTGLPAGEPSTVTALGYKRKHICNWPGCGKGFTTSGHLARHNRIHTGEKRYECLMPGCGSRFSRQDNMLQHYRTHLSGKSRKVSSLSLPIEPSHVAAAQAKLQAQQARLEAQGVMSDDSSSMGGSIAGSSIGSSMASSSGGGGVYRRTSASGRQLGRPPAYAWEGKPYGLVLDETPTERLEADLMKPLTLSPVPDAQPIVPSQQQQQWQTAPAAGHVPLSPRMGSSQAYPAGHAGGPPPPQIHIHHHYTVPQPAMDAQNDLPRYDEIMPPPQAPASMAVSKAEDVIPTKPTHQRPSLAGINGGFPSRTWHPSTPKRDPTVLIGPEVDSSLANYRAALAGHHLHEKTAVMQRQQSGVL